MSGTATEHRHAAFEQEAIDRGLVEDAHLDYADWLQATGLDDSFVGEPDKGRPGTADLYDAAVRVLARDPAPAP
jgi:hypothetical protein